MVTRKSQAFTKGCMDVFQMLQNIEAEHRIKTIVTKGVRSMLKVPMFNNSIPETNIHILRGGIEVLAQISLVSPDI